MYRDHKEDRKEYWEILIFHPIDRMWSYYVHCGHQSSEPNSPWVTLVREMANKQTHTSSFRDRH